MVTDSWVRARDVARRFLVRIGSDSTAIADLDTDRTRLLADDTADSSQTTLDITDGCPLDDTGIPSPSAAAATRNPHRSGQRWVLNTVPTILRESAGEHPCENLQVGGIPTRRGRQQVAEVRFPVGLVRDRVAPRSHRPQSARAEPGSQRLF
ncbi:hypothetical protein ACFWPQ_47765 [Streptomyces sp. NPDC058464]|uniref:hypothetical protein n=1 Tax=Streptomyces sp. NPDC058464 TaxID=3346511 RepID=UPI003667AA3F